MRVLLTAHAQAALDQLLDAAQHAQACAQLRARAGLNLVMHDVSSALAHARQVSAGNAEQPRTRPALTWAPQPPPLLPSPRAHAKACLFPASHHPQASQEARMAAQLSEALGAPGKWVPEDWGWGPTWVAEARMPPPPGQHTQVGRSGLARRARC